MFLATLIADHNRLYISFLNITKIVIYKDCWKKDFMEETLFSPILSAHLSFSLFISNKINYHTIDNWCLIKLY